jgi:hypothetical protein
VVGLDPGGTSKPPSRKGDTLGSPLALAAFDATNQLPIAHIEVLSPYDDLHRRLGDLSGRAARFLEKLEADHPGATLEFYHEEFVMLGKQGRDFQRMIGACIARVSGRWLFSHVQNTTVKAVLADHGQATKQRVAEGVLGYFKGDDAIAQLIVEKRWDALDAYAIGIAGHMVRLASNG